GLHPDDDLALARRVGLGQVLELEMAVFDQAERLHGSPMKDPLPQAGEGREGRKEHQRRRLTPRRAAGGRSGPPSRRSWKARSAAWPAAPCWARHPAGWPGPAAGG